MTDKDIKIRQQAYALTICTVVFMVVYNLCTWYASNTDNVQSFIFDFEKYIPFVPWMIIPYMAGGVFFCMVFFCCKSRSQLKLLTLRMIFTILIAGLCFIIIPLKFSFTKPEVSNPILNLPFYFLKRFDSPFNQSPSLHIAFAFIFWSVFKEISKWRIFLMISLLLLGFSTLTTYQHHLVDVLSGAILAHVTFVFIPHKKCNSKGSNIRLGNYCFLIGWILVTTGLLLYQYMGTIGSVLALSALAAFIAGYSFQKNLSFASPFTLRVRQNGHQATKN